jgi:DNA-binding SARP family transcriptional activator
MLRFGVLGPVEIYDTEGRRRQVGGPRQVALLAFLLVQANRAVSSDRLIDGLWGEGRPAGAVKRLQVAVARLRKGLEDEGRPDTPAQALRTVAGGYLLEVRPGELDADVMRSRMEEGRRAFEAGDPAGAAAKFRGALDLWRGPALADVAFESFAQHDIAILEEMRLSALEARVDADLRCGRHAALVGELEGLATEHPTRERLCEHLLLALYRCGRQADALEAYQRTRTRLAAELGLEPGPALKRLQAGILDHDPSLDLPPEPHRPSAARGPDAAEAPAPARRDEPTAPEPWDVAESRATVTVIVATLAVHGREAGVDAERTGQLLRLAHQEVERIVLRHGGRFQPGVGGAVVGVFGLEQTFEDDALRALRAADDLRAELVLGDALGTDVALAMGIGIGTGEVLIDRREAPQPLLGEPVDNAAGLAWSAGEGEILLDGATRRLASGAVRVSPAAGGSAHRLLGIVSGASTIRRRLETSLVGRDRELDRIRAAFDRAAAERSVQLLTVVGEAGVGKSRLAREATAQLTAEATTLTGRCLSYGEGITFWPFREALAQLAGAESADAIRGLIEGADDASLVADVVAAAIGLRSQASVGEQGPWAFRRLLEVLAEPRPVLVVIEDIHWAEPLLLELLEYLSAWLTRSPVLILCLARPELLDAHPAWGGARANAGSLFLERLSDEDTLRLLDEDPEAARLGRAEHSRILEAAEGNPLFVEQFIATHHEDPELKDELPSTIQALLAARLDRLAPGERTVIEHAAVIGREFWEGAVLHLLPAGAQPTAGGHIRTLVRRGLIQPDRTSLPGQEALRFHHVLIQETAYRRTTKRLRTDLHERFAEWLDGQTGDYDEIIGHHLDQANRLQRELGPSNGRAERLGLGASTRLGRAGLRALARGDAPAAATLLERAVDLAPESERGSGELLLARGVALTELGDLETAAGALGEVVSRAEAGGDRRLHWRAVLERTYLEMLAGAANRDCQDTAEAAVRAFEDLGDEAGLVRAWHLAALYRFEAGHAADALRAWEQVLAHLGGMGRADSEALCWMLMTIMWGPTPAAKGVARCEQAMSSHPADARVQGYGRVERGALRAMRGEIAQAREDIVSGRRILRDVGLSVTASTTSQEAFLVEMLAGDPAAAEAEMRAAWERLEEMGAKSWMASAAARLGGAASVQGRPYDAYELSETAERLAGPDDVDAQIRWRAVRATALAQGRDAEEACSLASDAVRLAEATDILNIRGEALTALGDALAAGGRGPDARAAYERARDVYLLKGNRVSAGGVSARIGGMAPA